MVVNFAGIDVREHPLIILKNASGSQIGLLGMAKNINVDLKYNEVSQLTFEIPFRVDGIDVPFYDDVVGMRVLELPGVGQFTLVSPTETSDGVTRKKSCTAYSLEYEFAYKKLSIPEGTYKFYDPYSPYDTVLGMIMEKAPGWSIGNISENVVGKYRTFSVENENVYNFIKNTVQESFNCIFDFDTVLRRVNVRDVNDIPISEPVYISTANLAKQIDVTEETESIVTRIDVNGAEGVNIRDVNPTGTNKLIELGYFMTETNFPSSLIEKYNDWKELIDDNKVSYYNLSVRYALSTEEKAAAEAKMADLQGELTGIDNVRGVTIQAIAQNLKTQADLDAVNSDYADKLAEVEAQQAVIDAIASDAQTIMQQLQAIVNACSYDIYFTQSEREQLDKYIKDGDVSDGSFVVEENATYADNGIGASVEEMSLSVTDAMIEKVTDVSGNVLYNITGGTLETGNGVMAGIISAVIEKRTDDKITATAYLGSGEYNSNQFPTACYTVSGTIDSFDDDAEDGIVLAEVTGFAFFTLNASEYQKRSVAWELYEFGEEALKKLAYPTYTFSVNCANFLAIDEFISFKNHISIGEKAYICFDNETVIEPICIGVRFVYGEPGTLSLAFSDSYVSSDSSFKLADLLDKSIGAGKNVELSKYVYSSFVDSGASNDVKEFMNGKLDASKNEIMSSGDQAVSWDGAGIRLRKWSDNAHTAYDDEQVWLCNNSILMTSDAWTTARMAIGKFYDGNIGNCWGIVAPMIVGTMIAGQNLVIESSKKDGSTAVFRVDADGCKLYNSDIEISKTVDGNTTQMILDPDIGIAMGKFPLYTVDVDGKKILNEENANFYADDDGNLHIVGDINATSLHIGVQSIEDFINGIVDDTVGTVPSDIRAWMTFTDQNGLQIGKRNSVTGEIDRFSVKLDGTELGFYDAGTKVAFISNNQLYINRARVLEQLVIGKTTGNIYQFEAIDGGFVLRFGG